VSTLHRGPRYHWRSAIGPLLCGLASVVTLLSASAQDHAHAIPSIPQELLERPVKLRSGIGKAHDAVSTKSAEAQAFYDQGLAYLHGYVWIEAARSFNQALRADANLAMAEVGLTFAYAELNKPDLAAAALARAQARASAASPHDRAHITARVLQAAAERAPKDTAALQAYRKSLDEALSQEPRDAELLMLRGIAESPDPADRGQGSTASAVSFYMRALAAGGTAADHYLTHAFENTNRVAEALPHAAAYARAAPELPHAVHMHGHVLRRSGQIDAAIAAFEAADRAASAYFRIERVPPEYDWHYEHNLDLLGSSYRYVGRMTDAARVLQRAFELPSILLVQMYNKRTWPDFLIARGRADDALAASRTLIAHPVTLVRAIGHIEAGRASLAAGRFDAAAAESNVALRELRAAADGQALVAPALQQLQGEFFVRTGQREKGRAMLEELAVRLRALPGPDNWVQALFTLESIAQSARAGGEWPLAQWAAEQMVAHDPGYAGSHFALALAADHAGDRGRAAAAFTAAAERWRRADADLPELSQARREGASR
jgi:tetratricopeptide (TPR) repeat protein